MFNDYGLPHVHVHVLQICGQACIVLCFYPVALASTLFVQLLAPAGSQPGACLFFLQMRQQCICMEYGINFGEMASSKRVHAELLFLCCLFWLLVLCHCVEQEQGSCQLHPKAAICEICLYGLGRSQADLPGILHISWRGLSQACQL